MIIVMRKGASKADLAAVESRITELGYKPHVIHGDTRNVVGEKWSLATEYSTGVQSLVEITRW